MSFDFFGEGIAETPSIKFTQQEENFFRGKLGILDPQSKKSIQLGTAVSFMKFSGLPPMTQKKIFDNLKLTGKSALDYSDMKKIFRGIALAQNKIEPSMVNINANIRTKMPLFHDEDSEEEQQKPSEVRQVEEKPKNFPPPTREQKIIKQETKQQVKPINQRPPPPIQKPEPKQQDYQTQQIKKFEKYWETLPAKGNLISGHDVKKIYGNSNNRKQLSKAWKLCSISEKGYLTKGQLFVFIHLIKDPKGHIPQFLNSKMKELIEKIDGSKSPRPSQKETAMRNSRTFDQFEKSQNLQRSHHMQPPKNMEHNMEKIVKLENQANAFNNVVDSSKKSIEKISEKAEEQSRALDSVMRNFDKVMEHNQQSKRFLDQTDHFISKVEERNREVRQRMDYLKGNQDQLTDRLNQTCVKMRDLIVKQSQFIDELLGQIENENQLDKQRVSILENYTQGMNEQINLKISNHSKYRESIRKTAGQKKKVVEEQPPKKKQEEIQYVPTYNYRYTSQQEHESPKQSIQQSVEKQSRVHIESPEHHPVRQQQPQHHEQHCREEYVEKKQEGRQEIPSQNPSAIKGNEDEDTTKRLHAKRVYTIQMINFITPIRKEEYPVIVEKITSMAEYQLDGLYAQLYKKYEQKVKQQNGKVEHSQPHTDDFSSNNFQPAAQQKTNADFFA